MVIMMYEESRYIYIYTLKVRQFLDPAFQFIMELYIIPSSECVSICNEVMCNEISLYSCLSSCWFVVLYICHSTTNNKIMYPLRPIHSDPTVPMVYISPTLTHTLSRSLQSMYR